MDELTIICSRPLRGNTGMVIAFQLLCCGPDGKLYTITPAVGTEALLLPVRVPKITWKEAQG